VAGAIAPTPPLNFGLFENCLINFVSQRFLPRNTKIEAEALSLLGENSD